MAKKQSPAESVSTLPATLPHPETHRGYRISEAAKYMGVSPWFVELEIRRYQNDKSTGLPALKLCRHYTILKEDMDAFLDAHRSAAA